MKTTRREFLHYEIKSIEDYHGMCGVFESEDDALEEINASHMRVKSLGYDDRDEKWAIICCKRVKTYLGNGDFYKEELTRTRVAAVAFDEYTNAFVRISNR